MQEVFEKIIEKLEEIKSVMPDLIEYQAVDDIESRCDEINDLIKEYNNGWIPVSERLPKNNKPVLCWVKSTTIASGETYIIGSCDNGFWFLKTYEIGTHNFPVKDYNVIAWQPLPELYVEGGGE